MKINLTIITVVFVATICTVIYSPAYALRIDVSPAGIGPGDAFVLRITGIRSSGPAAAFLEKRRFDLISCGEGCLIGVCAVPLDTGPGIRRIKLKVGSRVFKKSLRVKRVKFPTIHFSLPDDKVFPNPEDLIRAAEEDRRIKSIWEEHTERLWEGNFMLPIDHEASTLFGTRRIINEKKLSVHTGVDIKGREGDEVKASNRGRVVLAEGLFFGGNTVIIDHGQGIYTFYMHLSELRVVPGDTVPKGALIGLVGSTGRSSGPHLHFGAKVAAVSADPLSFLRLKL